MEKKKRFKLMIAKIGSEPYKNNTKGYKNSHRSI